jgi:hypothetical protein
MNIRLGTQRLVIVGPILDSAGAAKTDEVVTNVLLSKNGGAHAALTTETFAHLHGGFYGLTLTTGNTDTLGTLELFLDSGTNTMPAKALNVMTALAWDALYAASGGRIFADVDTIKTQTITCAANAAFGAFIGNATAAIAVDGSGHVTPTAASKTGYALVSTGMNAVVLPADIITAASVKADAVTKIQTGLATPTNITAGTITTVTNLTNLPAAAATAAELAKVPKSDSTVTWNATALASINAEVDAALNTAIPGSPTADSINERVATMDGRILGTLAAGTHTAQTGDGYLYLTTNLGALGANATEVGGTGDHLTALPASPVSGTVQINATTGWGGAALPTSFAVSDKTGFKLASDGLAQVTAWTVNFTGSLSGNVGGIAGTIQTFDGLNTSLSSVHGAASWATATSVTVSDKTGFILATTGLDSVAITAPTGPATNFREMLVQVWRRFFKKATKTSTQLITYADNGTTVVTTQTVSDDGTTETQGDAS